MQGRRNQECNRDAGQSARDGQELVELIVDGERNDAGKCHNDPPRQVLAHLPLARLRPRLEEPRLNDNISRVDDERVREEQVETEQDLHNVSDNVLLWQARRDERQLLERVLIAPSDRRVLAQQNVKARDQSHRNAQKLVIVFLVGGDLTDRQNDSDSFVRVYGKADSVGPE